MDKGPADRHPPSVTTAKPAPSERAPTVLFVGTSLTAGYGLDPAQAYPAVIAEQARAAGTPITAINAGVSGETSAGLRRRIDWVLRQPADIVVIETGANDALRGLNVSAVRSNVRAIVARVKRIQPSARLLIVQMEAPPNLGLEYTRGFREIYPSVARDEQLVLVPFLLDGVAGRPELNLPDGLHPNARGAQRVAENVWAVLSTVVAEVTPHGVSR